MKNKKGKSLIGLLLLLVAVGIFGYFGYSTMGAIKLGLDLAGGVSITYQAKEANPSSEDMADTIYKLQQRAELQHRGGSLPGRQQPYQCRYSRRFRCERDFAGTGQTRLPCIP
jgi:preprotein translocase subunit SecD